MNAFVVWDLEPTLIPGFEYLRWYSICWVIGIIVGYQIMKKVYEKEGLPVIELDKLVTYLMFGIILGARLGHVLFYDPVYYWNHPIEVLPFRLEPEFQFTGLAGLASHGGFLGALIVLYLYVRKFKRDFLWLLDQLMIAGAVLGGFIRLGNLLNSEIIGIPTNVPWAFVFTRIDQIPRHPAQLYEAIFYLLIGVAAYLLWKSRKFENKKGFIFGLGMTVIFTQRFFIEFLKENQVAFEQNLLLNMGQILSFIPVLAGIYLVVRSLKQIKQST